MAALFRDAPVGMLGEVPDDQDSERYGRGEHVAVWIGIELARLVKGSRVSLQVCQAGRNRLARKRYSLLNTSLAEKLSKVVRPITQT